MAETYLTTLNLKHPLGKPIFSVFDQTSAKKLVGHK